MNINRTQAPFLSADAWQWSVTFVHPRLTNLSARYGGTARTRVGAYRQIEAARLTHAEAGWPR